MCCVEDLHEDGGDDDDVGVKASFHMETVKEYITFSGRDVQRLCGTAYENKSAQFRWEAVKLLICVLILTDKLIRLGEGRKDYNRQYFEVSWRMYQLRRFNLMKY